MSHAHWNEEQRDSSPCHGCQYYAMCLRKQLLCRAFIAYVEGGEPEIPTKPRHKYYSKFLSYKIEPANIPGTRL